MTATAGSRALSLPSPIRRSALPTVETGRPRRRAIAGPDNRWRRRTAISVSAAASSRNGQECGRDERSPKPAAPSTRKRSRHLRTVLPSTPNADATAATVEPASRRSTISIRLRGVVLAFS